MAALDKKRYLKAMETYIAPVGSDTHGKSTKVGSSAGASAGAKKQKISPKKDKDVDVKMSAELINSDDDDF